MKSEDQAVLAAILRNDFPLFVERCFYHLNPGATFVPNWHIRAICYQLERVLRGEVTRLVINLPPRYLKSIIVSVAFAAYALGLEPRRRIFSISYGGELASKHASDFRSIVEAAWFRRAFPKMRIARSLEDEVITQAKGFRKATSVLGTLTGLGGDIFIIDDPQKPVDAQSQSRRNSLNQWVSNTLMSRLDNKEKGVIIVVMQRVHMDDLSGYLLAQEGWELLSLPAIATEDEQIPIGPAQFHRRRLGEPLHGSYESLETLQKLKRTLGSDNFSAQYQQSPVPAGGLMIQRSWLRFYRPDQLPERSYRTKVIQSWDTAAKSGAQNDYSVCTTWLLAGDDFYLLDMVRDRYEYPRLKETAVALARRFEPHAVLVEEASTGIALAQELRSLVRTPIRPIKIEHDKVGRVYVQQAKFESGRVFFPKNADFMPDLLTELLTFPQGKTDDIVDSISQALAYQRGGYDTSLDWVGNIEDLRFGPLWGR